MKKRDHPRTDAWAVVVERGYSESFIAIIEKLDSLKFWRPALGKVARLRFRPSHYHSADARGRGQRPHSVYSESGGAPRGDKPDHVLLCRLHRQRQVHLVGSRLAPCRPSPGRSFGRYSALCQGLGNSTDLRRPHSSGCNCRHSRMSGIYPPSSIDGP
jgi:hypothetical protein